MRVFTLLAVLLVVDNSSAAVKTKVIEYEFDGIKLKGFLAWDDAVKEKRPGILVVHEWWGLNDYAKDRAKKLAEMGYVAFCVDMYGDGKTTEHPMDAANMSGTVRKNVQIWQGRAEAGLKTLKAQPEVDSKKIAAIGYCFGGSTALQLAYTGAEVAAVVTFHAALPTPSETQAKAIKGRVLVCHGADDFFIPKTSIELFRGALDKAGTKYQFESYPGAVHSFTVKGSDDKKIKGMAYHEDADKKSWEQMMKLFKDTLGR